MFILLDQSRQKSRLPNSSGKLKQSLPPNLISNIPICLPSFGKQNMVHLRLMASG
jgi:hypothetical protein